MKAVLFLFLALFLALNLKGQEDNGNQWKINYYGFQNGFSSVRFYVDGGYSFRQSPFGVFGFVEYAKEFVPESWFDLGYPKQIESYGLNACGGFTFKKEGSKVFVGINVGGQKGYCQPIVGIFYKKEKLDIEAMGSISIKNRFIKNEEFDPDSWYLLRLNYDINNYFGIGVVSERFYLTGIELDYMISKRFSFTASLGKNIEFDQNVFSIGLKVLDF